MKDAVRDLIHPVTDHELTLTETSTGGIEVHVEELSEFEMDMLRDEFEKNDARVSEIEHDGHIAKLRVIEFEES